MNPLLEFSGLPCFDRIKPEHVGPAIDELLAAARAAVAAATQAPPTWEAFVAPLEDANERLGRAWGQVAHLHAVMDAPPLREAYNASLPKVSQYWTELGQNQALFEKYKELAGSRSFAFLSQARKKIVENALRDFRLGGAELPPEKKQIYAAIQEELAKLSAKFSENVLDATNAFSIVVDEKRISGIPQDVLQSASEAAEKDGKRGWKFTLHAPSYLPVMQYADDRTLRETLYRENATRAAEFGKPQWDNTSLIARIVSLRREIARLLGYANFAEVSLEPKMAETPAQVLAFLEDLARHARPFAERDASELKQFASAELGIETLEAWDVPYASEKLRAKRYAFSDQEVKQYFPEDVVLQGLFRVAETLYQVEIVPSKAPVWHEEVRFFDIRDAAGTSFSTLVGQFYMDLYARETKRGGAWMDDAITRRRKGSAIQTPVAYLNCNFSRPVGGKPALFTHDEAHTLFHEFGHGLHHLLTRVDDLGVSGINGVEWDAVELPSQFMENFAWEWDVLRHMTRHVDTGAPLPRALFDKMLAAKNFHSGLAMLRQIEFAVFDMQLHSDFDPASGRSARELLEEVRERIAVLRPPAYNRFANSFSHIFAGGYAAGYYSYKWAEVLSADAYGFFEENGILDPRAGARFRDEILAVGGSRPAAESFRAFRGREPRVEALLRHSGMIAA
ncbi:MAG: oligopeptidase A [Betaproteobacteria bacterium RIFCSPLOWO2_12_FULL_66_14]|nr:MAG: oligopeptidase A [Betaproteobacteria bacterium RIFCSPLOWO2_12_FULL_66_14]